MSWTAADKTKFAHELLSVLGAHRAKSSAQIQAWRSRIEDVLLVYDCPLPRRERQALLKAVLHATKVMCRDAAVKGAPVEWNRALAVMTAGWVGEYIDRPHLL